MCTLGKAVGTFGAFVAGSPLLIESLLQRARTYIYTTALPPAVAAATRESLRVMQDEPWRRSRVLEHAARFRAGLADLGLPSLPSRTPIQPVLIGAEAAAVVASHAHLGRAAGQGGLGAGDPPADGARRHVAPALHVLGVAHRGTGRAVARRLADTA